MNVRGQAPHSWAGMGKTDLGTALCTGDGRTVTKEKHKSSSSGDSAQRALELQSLSPLFESKSL